LFYYVVLISFSAFSCSDSAGSVTGRASSL